MCGCGEMSRFGVPQYHTGRVRGFLVSTQRAHQTQPATGVRVAQTVNPRPSQGLMRAAFSTIISMKNYAFLLEYLGVGLNFT